jgi:glycosyltransferase involved in cell wall biosynthesis
MSKILINTPDEASKGGVAQYYKVMKLNEQTNIDYFSINNSVQGNIIFRLLSMYYKFFIAIKGYDVVGLNPSLDRKSFFRDAIFAFLTKFRNKKLLVFWHGWGDTFEEEIHRQKYLKFIFDKTFGKTDGFLVLGNIFKEKLLRLGISPETAFHRETMSVSTEWINKFDLSKKWESRKGENELNLLFLSRIVKEKGIYICVNAAQRLQEKYPNIKVTMHIAGDGVELAPLKNYAKEKGTKNVIFYGDIRGEKKYNLLSNADIFFFPTYYGEGFPNAIVEGLFFGLPVITRPIAAIPDIIKPGFNGYLDIGKSAEDFIPYVEAYLSLSESEKYEFAKNCHEDALSKYKVEDIRVAVIKYYNSF